MIAVVVSIADKQELTVAALRLESAKKMQYETNKEVAAAHDALVTLQQKMANKYLSPSSRPGGRSLEFTSDYGIVGYV